MRGVSKPEEIFDPYKNMFKQQIKSAGENLQKIQPVVEFVNKPQEILYQKAESFVAKTLGPKGVFIFDLATFSQRFYNQLAPTGTEAIAQALKEQNPFIVLAAPLAAAIHTASNRYKHSAKPLPDDVRQGLGKFFDANILNVARYAVGSVEITLPNVIGQGKKFMGDHYAVVVGDIIVFNVQPPNFRQASWWWAHEVMHIVQYHREGGIERFAYEYTKDLGNSLEAEADKKGDEVFIEQVKTDASGVAFFPRSKIFRSRFAGQELIKMQCIINGDTIPLSYVVTSKSKILAVSPLDGEFIHIGYAKLPRFAGVEWEFSTTKGIYHVLSNGDIMIRRAVRNPLGQIINYQLLKVGKAVKFDE